MKQMKAAIPGGLAHLRDGAVSADNPALVRALADLKSRRIGALAAFFCFAREGREPLLYYYKRIKECSLLAERLAPLGVPLDVTIGDAVDLLPARLLRHDARILYAAPEDPEPDPAYRARLEGTLREFDVVEAPGRVPPTLRIPPYWRIGLHAPGSADETSPLLVNRFLADPASLGSDLERLDAAEALRRLIEEEP